MSCRLVNPSPRNGEGRIRTSVGYRRQIYSLLPLATRVPLHVDLEPVWSRWSESNRRPADYKSAALPLSYIGGPHRTPRRAPRPVLVRATSLAASRASGAGTAMAGSTPSLSDRKRDFVSPRLGAVKERSCQRHRYEAVRRPIRPYSAI